MRISPKAQKGNRAVKALDQAWQHLDEGARTVLEAAGWTPTHPQPPPGLEARGAMSDQEYKEAAQSLWNGADEAAKILLKEAGIEEPKDEQMEEVPPKVRLQKTMAAYKQNTNELRSLIAKKVQLQSRTERLKEQFEQSMKELAAMSEKISQKEQDILKIQSAVKEQVEKEDQPKQAVEASRLLRCAGIALTPEQQAQLNKHLRHEAEEGEPQNFPTWKKEVGVPAELIGAAFPEGTEFGRQEEDWIFGVAQPRVELLPLKIRMSTCRARARSERVTVLQYSRWMCTVGAASFSASSGG